MIRKATIADIKSIHSLLNDYGRKGELLARPLSELYDHVRDFSVFEDQASGTVVGCCALQFCWEDLAEIRSLAVEESFQGKSIGSMLVRNALVEARSYRIREIFALTYRPSFFSRFEFSKIDRAELPIKIWSDCVLCVKFPDCDETAMKRMLER